MKNELALVNKEQLASGISKLHHRGPDNEDFKIDANIGLAHARLSIIDLSPEANQPMVDETNRYTLVFNGEIYNYEELKLNLPDSVQYRTNSDSEVLLQYLIHFGLSRLNDLNGFFSFLFYDKEKKEMLFARDRFGIKPLLIYEDKKKVILSSEISPFFSFDIDKKLSQTAIDLLFQLTYIPGPFTILQNASVILPGHCGSIKNGIVKTESYYDLTAVNEIKVPYAEAVLEVKHKIKTAVKRRLVADVPLGTFLSGGVDSSIVSLVAKEFKSDLKTFSVGFDVPYFDESNFAKEMAESIDSNHHQIMLTKADFKMRFESFLALNHQPFADSSAFAVYLLSEKTKEHLTVCLSGDGADELFGGYRKHEAEFKLKQLSSIKKALIKSGGKIARFLPKGRHGKWPELNRKLQKFVEGLNLSPTERYIRWQSFISVTEKNKLLRITANNKLAAPKIDDDLNSILRADQLFVLPNDMLTKVDRMSMAHGLEVRTPFLDHELVDFVNSLPASYKVNKHGRKQLLIDAFKDELPENIYKRPKKGFEIPIFDWLKDEIETIFDSVIFSKEIIENQGIFNFNYICQVKKEFKNAKFGDNIYLIWTLIVFQNWWYRNIWK